MGFFAYDVKRCLFCRVEIHFLASLNSTQVTIGGTGDLETRPMLTRDKCRECTCALYPKPDLWGTEWRARTGFPLTNYQEKWESLKLVEKGDAKNGSAGI